MSKDIVEALAAVEHEQWVYWATGLVKDLKYVTAGHGFLCDCNTCKRLKRWSGLCAASYESLPEGIKEDDRRWARRVIQTLNSMGSDIRILTYKEMPV